MRQRSVAGLLTSHSLQLVGLRRTRELTLAGQLTSPSSQFVVSFMEVMESNPGVSVPSMSQKLTPPNLVDLVALKAGEVGEQSSEEPAEGREVGEVGSPGPKDVPCLLLKLGNVAV